MYAVTTTPGFIIGMRPYGEAGRMLSIFTRDLGLVLAAAQGIRLEKSKLRYHTQEYSLGNFSFVRGKEMWRLTSAQESHVNRSTSKIEVLFRMATLLRRLLHGEDPHPELFDCVESMAGMIALVPAERLPELESLTALRILNLLGYIGDNEMIRPFVSTPGISEEILSALSPLRQRINGIINASLQASHL